MPALEFWKDYIILDFEVPKVKQQKDFCEAYASSLELLEDEKKLKAYRSSYNNTKVAKTALKEATELCDKYSQYIEYLKVKDNKKVISFADLNMLKKIEANIKAHKKANELLYNLPVTFEQHNEFHINWEVEKFNIQCKSLLDRVCFDHVNKKIILIDLKTTQNVYNFAHSVEEYDYYRQIAYYGLAIQWYMQEVLNLNSEEYDFEAYMDTHQELSALYADREKWLEKAIMNTAMSGFFSSDRTINEYNEKIWKLTPIK